MQPTKRRMHYLWKEWMRFSQVSRRWGEADCTSFSVSGPCSSALSLLRQAPLRGSRCICIGVNMFKPIPLAGHPESNLQKNIMAGKGDPIVYYKVTDDWPSGSQTPRLEKRGSLLLVASIILSTLAIGVEDVPSRSPVSMAFCLKQVGDIHGLPSDKHRDCFAGRKRSAGERH